LVKALVGRGLLINSFNSIFKDIYKLMGITYFNYLWPNGSNSIEKIFHFHIAKPNMNNFGWWFFEQNFS